MQGSAATASMRSSSSQRLQRLEGILAAPVGGQGACRSGQDGVPRHHGQCATNRLCTSHRCSPDVCWSSQKLPVPAHGSPFRSLLETSLQGSNACGLSPPSPAAARHTMPAQRRARCRSQAAAHAAAPPQKMQTASSSQIVERWPRARGTPAVRQGPCRQAGSSW